MDKQKAFDFTTLDHLATCPRKAYYRMIRHWTPESPAPALVNGLAWHSALETVYLNNKLPLKDMHVLGVNAFVETWDSFGLSRTDFYPRGPGRAMEVLEKYLGRFGGEIAETEVLGVELPFKVPLNEDASTFYGGRFDALVRLPQLKGVVVLEHKTTSSIATSFMNQFTPNAQVDGYLHGLYMLHGTDSYGVIINGCLFQKTKVDFARIPVIKQFNQLDQWMWEVKDKVIEYQFEVERLEEQRGSTQRHGMVLTSFPRRTNSCHHYGGCAYRDLCRAKTNPELWDEPPQGFIEDKWNPYKEETKDG